MNDTPVKVGAVYKLRDDYDNSFFQYDHNEKYIMVLEEDYSGLHPIVKVLIYYKEGIDKNGFGFWSIKSFERWELISEAG